MPLVEIPMICRYCGGAVHLVPAAKVYGPAAAKRLGLEREKFYQCQNCNARVGCHKGSTRPLGNLANEALRMKRMETHQVFDNFWKERGMSRTQGYKWMAKKLRQMIMSHMITEQASFLLTFANQQLLQLTITKKCFLILDIIQKQILSNTIHI